MRSVMCGVAANPATNATNFAHVANSRVKAWTANENSSLSDSTMAVSDAITIKKFTVQVTTAPGGATSWTFKVRQNAADSAASVTISAAATTATWTGSISVAQLDLLCVSSVNGGTPAAAGAVYYTIEYESVGSDYYLLPSSAITNQNVTMYANPFGGGCPWSGTATDFEALVPTDLTVTKIAGSMPGTPGNAGSSYTYVVRKNNTTDSSFSAVITQSISKAVSSAGALVFAPGDTIVIKRTSTSGPAWWNSQVCLTVVPTYPGEVAFGFGNLQQPSTTVTNYEAPNGVGANAAWNATEASVSLRLPAALLKKLYVKLVTATGAAKSRAFTIRSAAADTAVTTTITNAATGNDTTNTASHLDGNLVALKAVPTSTPAATSGVKFGFVAVIPQSGSFLPMF